jgi:hypothetical protein
MSRTLLTHVCGSPVVLSLNESMNLIAPSFSFTTTGIKDFTLDLIPRDAEKLIPKYICTKCNKTIEDKELENNVVCLCQICGEEHTVKETYVHSIIASICSKCRDDIKSGTNLSSRQREYSNVFGLKIGMKLIPLIKVLTNPIKL